MQCRKVKFLGISQTRPLMTSREGGPIQGHHYASHPAADFHHILAEMNALCSNPQLIFGPKSFLKSIVTLQIFAHKSLGLSFIRHFIADVFNYTLHTVVFLQCTHNTIKYYKCLYAGNN